MVRKIKGENFKCFEQIELELSNLNMFSGVNSMGKSTLIQLFLLLRQSYEQNALEKGIYLNGRYTNLGVGKVVLYAEVSLSRRRNLILEQNFYIKSILQRGAFLFMKWMG